MLFENWRGGDRLNAAFKGIKMQQLNSLLRLLEKTFTAAAFAEEGEHETALELTGMNEAEQSICCGCSASRKKQPATLAAAA